MVKILQSADWFVGSRFSQTVVVHVERIGGVFVEEAAGVGGIYAAG